MKEADLNSDKTATSKSYAINVTARDIALGVRNHSEACPVARAAMRQFRAEVRVQGEILVDLGGLWMRRLDLPEAAQNFIHDFDAGRPVAPFKFRVREL